MPKEVTKVDLIRSVCEVAHDKLADVVKGTPYEKIAAEPDAAARSLIEFLIMLDDVSEAIKGSRWGIVYRLRDEMFPAENNLPAAMLPAVVVQFSYSNCRLMGTIVMNRARVAREPVSAINHVMREFCRAFPNGEMYFAVSDAVPTVRWMHEHKPDSVPADAVRA